MPHVGDYPLPVYGEPSYSSGTDLFAAIGVDRYKGVIEIIERRVDKLISDRHKYPIWPHHNGPLDPYEQSFHGLIRHPYYRVTIELIQVLRALRELA
jgi:hypothetical protein